MRVNQPITQRQFNIADFEKVTACPWCGSGKNEQWGEDDGYFNTVECKGCGLIYVNSRLTVDATHRYYANYFSEEHQAVPEAKVRGQMYQLEFDLIYQYIKSGKVLDIGCSGGEFLDYFRNKGFDCHGIEVGTEAAAIAQKKYGKDQIFDTPLLKTDIKGPFDLIILRGTIEHIPDAKENLIKAASLLNHQKKSYLYITSTPNSDCVCARLFKTKWTQHLPEEHLYHFRKELFDELFRVHKLSRVAVHHFYEETPYANVEQDILKVAEAFRLKNENKEINFKSPAFYGNMMSLVYST